MKLFGGQNLRVLQQQLRYGNATEPKRRRAIIKVSFAGMGAMSAVSALQTGMVSDAQ